MFAVRQCCFWSSVVQIPTKGANFNRAVWRSNCIAAMPRIDVQPKVALVDKKVVILANGLDPQQKVTIKAWLNDGKAVFGSCAHYVADDHGSIDVTKQPSLGGTFSGIESMGLFWSLKAIPMLSKKTRLIKLDVTNPYAVSLTLFKGHIQFDEIHTTSAPTLATTTCERWYKGDQVQRIVVKEGAVRGTLFLPTGNGPFPGLIDMFGSTGGLVEHRAALLATHGYAVLALAYFGYDDLPNDVDELDIRYFLDAVDWLGDQRFVTPGGIGIIGTSKGGEIALIIGSLSNKVKAIVNIGGSPAVSFADFKLDGKLYMKAMKYLPDRRDVNEEGVTYWNCFPEITEVIPVWRNNAPLLYMCSKDDGTWDTHKLTSVFMEHCPSKKRSIVELVIYPDAGHLLEPPYMPLCRVSYHKMLGESIIWGGVPKAHARAQEDAWNRLLSFLKKNLSHITASHL